MNFPLRWSVQFSTVMFRAKTSISRSLPFRSDPRTEMTAPATPSDVMSRNVMFSGPTVPGRRQQDCSRVRVGFPRVVRLCGVENVAGKVPAEPPKIADVLARKYHLSGLIAKLLRKVKTRPDTQLPSYADSAESGRCHQGNSHQPGS